MSFDTENISKPGSEDHGKIFGWGAAITPSWLFVDHDPKVWHLGLEFYDYLIIENYWLPSNYSIKDRAFDSIYNHLFTLAGLPIASHHFRPTGPIYNYLAKLLGCLNMIMADRDNGCSDIGKYHQSNAIDAKC